MQSISRGTQPDVRSWGCGFATQGALATQGTRFAQRPIVRNQGLMTTDGAFETKGGSFGPLRCKARGVSAMQCMERWTHRDFRSCVYVSPAQCNAFPERPNQTSARRSWRVGPSPRLLAWEPWPKPEPPGSRGSWNALAAAQ